MGTFNRETDIAWDAQDNMYVSDGYGNSRVVKIAKDGTWVKAVGTYGNGENQFNTPHSIAVDKEAGARPLLEPGEPRLPGSQAASGFLKNTSTRARPSASERIPS